LKVQTSTHLDVQHIYLKPTYEGLKAMTLEEKLAAIKDLKPTYEGLKVLRQGRDTAAPHRFKAYL